MKTWQSDGSTRTRRPRPWKWFAAVTCLAAAAWGIGVLNIAVPECGFHSLTGLPCPLCGGTRAMQAVADLDFVSALKWNPLVCATVVFVIARVLLEMSNGIWGATPGRRFRLWVSRQPRALPLAMIVIANWAYLIAVAR